jgi:hypothetical protein
LASTANRPSVLGPAIVFLPFAIALYAAAIAFTHWSVALGLVAILSLAACGLYLRGIRSSGILGPLSIAATSVLLSFVLRPLILLLQPEPPDPGVTVFGLWMLIGTVAGLCVSVGLGRGFPIERILGKPAMEFTPRRVVAAAIACAAVGLFCLGLLFVVTRFSAIRAFTCFADFRVLISHDGLSYLSLPAMWGMWAPSWLLVAFTASRHGQVSRRWWIGLAAVSAGALVLSVPFGTRQALLGPAIGAVFIVDRLWKRLTPIFVLIATLLFFGVFTGYSVARDLAFCPPGVEVKSEPEVAAPPTSSPALNPQNLATELAKQDAGHLTARFEGRFEGFDWLSKAIAAGVFTERPPTYGGTTFNILVQPIPRALWHEKPYKTSAYLVTLTFGDAYELHFTPEFTLASESFVDFRWFGLIPGGMLLGVLILSLERLARAADRSPAAAFVYAPLIMTPLGWLQAGFNSDWTIGILFVGGLSLVVARWISSPPRERSGP